MKHLTIRDIPPKLMDALERESHRRGESIDQTVIGVLSEVLGTHPPRSNGLAALAGSWTDEEFEEFERAVRSFDDTGR